MEPKTEPKKEPKTEPKTEKPSRLLYPIPEAREKLGGIGHSFFYSLVKAGEIKLTKIRGRSFVTAAELRRRAGVSSDEPV